MKKTVLALLSLTTIALALPSQSFAAQTPNCTPIYGGGDSCIQNDRISVNKQVQNPDTEEYVDNLTATSAYDAGQTVLFKITVSNTSTGTLNNITVKDTFPTIVTYSKGQGNYNQSTRVFSFTIDELKAKENKVYFAEGKVVAEDKLPKTAQSRCVINQVEVATGDRVSRDNSRVCISGGTGEATASVPTPTPTKAATTKGGTKIYPPSNTKQTPDTGPEALALAGLIPLGGLGFWLRKKATN